MERTGAEVGDLRAAWRAFRAKPGPWVVALALAAAVAVRAALGAAGWRDAVAAALMLAVYPFGEWAIHAHLLHLAPLRVRGRVLELPTARAHRAHHEHPERLDLINLSPLEAAAVLGLAVPAAVGLGAAAALPLPGPLPVAPLVTALATGYALVGAYEWMHFLIHTARRPRSPAFRAVWRTHRLHHYKSEHAWFGVTTTIGDRVMGTAPDHREVPRSPTARTLR